MFDLSYGGSPAAGQKPDSAERRRLAGPSTDLEMSLHHIGRLALHGGTRHVQSVQ